MKNSNVRIIQSSNMLCKSSWKTLYTVIGLFNKEILYKEFTIHLKPKNIVAIILKGTR